MNQKCLICQQPVVCDQGSTHYSCGGVPGATGKDSIQRAADHAVRLLKRRPNRTSRQLSNRFRPELADYFDAGLHKLIQDRAIVRDGDCYRLK